MLNRRDSDDRENQADLAHDVAECQRVNFVFLQLDQISDNVEQANQED